MRFPAANKPNRIGLIPAAYKVKPRSNLGFPMECVDRAPSSPTRPAKDKSQSDCGFRRQTQVRLVFSPCPSCRCRPMKRRTPSAVFPWHARPAPRHHQRGHSFNRLVMRSNKPEAKEIQTWIVRDVLPAIRWARTAAQGWDVREGRGEGRDHGELSAAATAPAATSWS